VELALNILIADDATFFRNFIKSSINLVNIDANFIESNDGKMLFSLYEQYVPEITIIDHALPNADVLNFAKKILGIHPIATIIVFVDSADHEFVKNAKAMGVEVMFKSIGQFPLGTNIKKMLSKKADNVHHLEKKSHHNLTNALTMTTLDSSASGSQYVKLTNATLQRRIQNIEELKKLGEDFDDTIKHLYDKNTKQTESNSSSETNNTSQNSSNFFMKELSNDVLIGILKDKVLQLKETQAKLEQTNNKLTQTVADLEESKMALLAQKEDLEAQVAEKAKSILKSEKLVTVGELSARIAHDLRNPLNVIKNTLDILKFELSDTLTERQMEQWRRLDRGIYRMTHQVDDVLDFVKQRPLQKTKTKMSTLLADMLERINVPSNIEIHLPQNDCDILCDGEKIEVVFLNLILNAIQAMDQNPGSISIVIQDGQPNPDYVTIEIQDTGPGIPKILHEKIFDPLFTTRQIGTGLGLTSCKRIVEAHQGTITFESKVGVGTIFFIRLPKKTEWSDISSDSEGAPQLTH